MKITVLGAGAYGVALATILNEKNDVTVYSVIKSEIDSLTETYRNEKLFPNIEISRKIKFDTNKLIELTLITFSQMWYLGQTKYGNIS